MAVTMRQIAERLNVSQATVSRVLSGVKSPFISEATRERVRKAAEEMGYKLNPLARSLATGKTQTVSVWIRNPDAPFYARVLRDLASQTGARGYELILSGVQLQPRVLDGGNRSSIATDLASNRRATLNWPVDGVLCVDMTDAARQLMETDREGGSARRSAPIVIMGSDPLEGCDFVGCEHAAALGDATRRLIAAGRRRLAHLTSPLAIASVAADRRRAVEEACAAAGVPCEVLEAADETKAAARAVIRERWHRDPKPDGLIALNDDLAIGAYRGLRDLKLRVPEDVAVIGCDGIEAGEFLDVPLSTVVQPVAEMAQRAWELLAARMNDPAAAPRRVMLPARYEPRASAP